MSREQRESLRKGNVMQTGSQIAPEPRVQQ
jgi:hypothetical protein